MLGCGPGLGLWGRYGSAYISSVSRSMSGCTSATWSLQHMTFPSADNRSSILCILTASGMEFRRCCSSWSVVDVGTRRPLRFLQKAFLSACSKSPEAQVQGLPGSQPSHYSCSRDGGMTDGYDILQFRFEYTVEIL